MLGALLLGALLLALLFWLGAEENGAMRGAWEDMRCGIWTESEDPGERAAQALARDTARLLRR